VRRSLVRSVLFAYVLVFTGAVSYGQHYVPPAPTAPATAPVQTPPATAPTQTSSPAQATVPAGSPMYDPWWYSDANPGPVPTFLANGPHSGIAIVTPGPSPSRLSANIMAKGYQIMNGIGGYAAQWAQNYPKSNACGGAGTLSEIEGQIDAEVVAGAKWIYVDEPCPWPGESSITSPTSIAKNTAGFNIIYNYIHSKHPGVNFGLSSGGEGAHYLMLKAGLHEDFASMEYYNSCCETENPFVHSGVKAAFPNVKEMLLTYGTETLCQGNSTKTGAWMKNTDIDIWAAWDVDGFAGNASIGGSGYIGPLVDAGWLQNFETFAATGSPASFCVLPYSFINPNYWTGKNQTANFTTYAWDFFWYHNWNQPYQMGICQYQIMSGSGGGKGPNDPSMKATVPWTNRTCGAEGSSTGSPIKVTVGPTGACNVIGTDTCLLMTRAYTTTGILGTMTYQVYNIDF
jgi:hypothetical protein